MLRSGFFLLMASGSGIVSALSCDTGTFASSACVPGVYIIVARGSTEAPGLGLSGTAAFATAMTIPNSQIVPLVYPADVNYYLESIAMGVQNMTKLIEDYVDLCPEGRIALIGYDQGAQVVGDTLIGNGVTTDGLPLSTYANNIVAAIQFGDPEYLPGQSYDQGTNTNVPGAYERTNYLFYTAYGYASKIQTYCDTGDAFCARGGEDQAALQVHYNTPMKYAQVAASFIVKNAQAACTADSGGKQGGTVTNTLQFVPEATSSDLSNYFPYLNPTLTAPQIAESTASSTPSPTSTLSTTSESSTTAQATTSSSLPTSSITTMSSSTPSTLTLSTASSSTSEVIVGGGAAPSSTSTMPASQQESTSSASAAATSSTAMPSSTYDPNANPTFPINPAVTDLRGGATQMLPGLINGTALPPLPVSLASEKLSRAKVSVLAIVAFFSIAVVFL